MFDSMGLKTALKFVQLSQEWVHARMGVVGLRMWKELQGIELYTAPKTADHHIEELPQRNLRAGTTRTPRCGVCIHVYRKTPGAALRMP